MGVKISRIEKEFILKALDDSKEPLKIHGHRIQREGLLLEMKGDEFLEVFSERRDLDVFKSGEKLRFFFSFYGHVMTFDTEVVRAGEVLTVRMPDRIMKNLQRKYERVKPEGVHLSFAVDDMRIELDFPKSEEYIDVSDFDTADLGEWEDTEDINDLVGRFREEAAKFSDVSRIIMFRSRKPQLFNELLVASKGQILYIPDMEKPEVGLPVDDEGMNYHTIRLEGLDEVALEGYTIKRTGDNIYAEITCPILFQEYVVGYVYLANNRRRKRLLNREALEYVSQFSRVLSWKLQKNGYFRDGKPVPQTFSPEIVDISGAGLLFTDSSSRLNEKLLVYSDIDLYLELSERRIKIFSRVMRKYQAGPHFFYGVQFLEMEPEDFRVLFEYVYGRHFKAEDETLWEGGAAPPELNL